MCGEQLLAVVLNTSRAASNCRQQMIAKDLLLPDWQWHVCMA